MSVLPDSPDLMLDASLLKSLALKVGFDACGLAKAESLDEDAQFLRDWLEEGNQGDMSYLAGNFEKRTNPALLVPGCKTVLVTLLNYYPAQLQSPDAPGIAKYAFSNTDYHKVIKSKLTELEVLITSNYGEKCFAGKFQHRFVDSAPVLERRWAQKAGLGWIGKHTQLISPGFGSYVFIGVLMLNAEVNAYDSPIRERCGSCTKCLNACPTNALVPLKLDARKCISYLTIETKSAIPAALKSKLKGYINGCDICADVCPWNHKWANANNHAELAANEFMVNADIQQWNNLDEITFNQQFKTSAIQRAGYHRISNNLKLSTQFKDARSNS